MTIRMQDGISRMLVRAGTLVAGLAALMGTAFAQDASIKGTVNIVGFSGVFADNYQKFIIDPFKAKYPGIDVTYQQSKNSAETLALLTLQRADPKVDIALIDVAVAIKANKDGIFAKLDPAKITTLSEMPEWARIDGDTADANRWSIGFQWQFGTGSARENAEHGATWNGAERQYEDTLGGF